MIQIINNIPVFGDVDVKAIDQIRWCASFGAYGAALMADGHLGYSCPIGGVVAFEDSISPNCVGFDIACGNAAVKLDLNYKDIQNDLPGIVDTIWNTISFGVGQKNKIKIDHELFDDPSWRLLPPEFKKLAAEQLGTIGSGNHFVDLFRDGSDQIWIGVHFGSRGLGHKIASHFIKEGGGKDGIDSDPVLFEANSTIGFNYIECMNLAGRYAYAGRIWVCNRIKEILGCNIEKTVHNHHNFAWRETHNGKDLWVIRKGATPAFPGQTGFIGGSMGDDSYIIEGIDSDTSKRIFYSTVHGAGRVMSRNEARGKRKYKAGKVVVKGEGKISKGMMQEWLNKKGVILRGADVDESPHVYKRLDEVLAHHSDTIKILHKLTPIAVMMAGEDVFDPYKD